MRSPYFIRLSDDSWFDEVRVEVDGADFLRVVTRYRYKTSGLSGDEWRISTLWQYREGDEWVDFDNGYHKIEQACIGIFPGIYTSHRDWHDLPFTGVTFWRKGHCLYRATYDDTPIRLLDALGHLPWAKVLTGENLGSTPPELEGGVLCMQPGCAEPATVVYRLKSRFSWGEGYERVLEVDDPHHRAFCQRHARRGDCGLEDADRNYVIVSSPDVGATTNPEDESPAVFGGVIELTEAP